MSLDAHVLVADDDPINRELLTRALKAEGCEVSVAEDGARALRTIRAHASEIDLVLLDMVMPEMDGFEVLRYLKGERDYARLPVIVISGRDDVGSVVKCLELGADDYLTKPFDPVLLRARIGNSLARKRHSDTERRYLHLLEKEEEKSERLILNVLPRHVADRLKAGETLIADHIEDVSVLFSDLVGFTAFTATRSARDVVTVLNTIVTRFDELAMARQLEKIKTIGDAYLAAGGLTKSSDDHVAAAIEMSFDMLDVIAQVGEGLSLRIGIAVGDVVAGVIGAHKFSYDIWGDTVNVASRMESHGLSGRVHVTEAIRDRLAGRFEFDARGAIELKGRGEMKTFLVVDPAGPNVH
jgi:adenylate cyclase